MTEQMSAAIDALFALPEMDYFLEKMIYYFDLDEGANEQLFELLSCAAGNDSFGQWNDVRREDAVAVFTRLIVMKDMIVQTFKAHIEKHMEHRRRKSSKT